MNFTSVPAPLSLSSRRQPVVRLGRVLLVTTLAAAIIACAPARKADYPSPLFASVAVDQSPSMVIKKDIDLVRLEGALGSQAQVDLVTQSAGDLFGAEMIINSLTVDETLEDANWLPGVLQTVNAMRDVADFSLVAGSGHLIVGGTVDSYDKAEEVADIASDLAGLTLAVSSTIDYPESTVVEDAVVVENTVSEPPLVPEEGLAVSLVSLAVLEQQAIAVAIEQPAVLPVAAVAVAPDQPLIASTTESVDTPPVAESVAVSIDDPMLLDDQIETDDVVVVPASANKPVIDTDGDGVADPSDECTSRSGYPVNNRGCQLLDGYLKDVHFYGASDQLTEDAMVSLNNIADIMVSHPVSKIAVLSYSQDGSPGEMRKQARDRAYSVVDYLVSQGIDPARLQAFALSHRQGISEQILIKEVD